MGKRKRKHLDRPILSIPEAECMAEGLPDGAWWALMEELTDMEPAEIADWYYARNGDSDA